MARNTMQDLQNHLFEVIEGLKNNNDPNASENEKMDLETAKAISLTAKVIIDIAKTEVDFLRVISGAANPEAVKAKSKNLMLGEAYGQDEE